MQKTEGAYPFNGVVRKVEEIRQILLGAFAEIEALKTRIDKLTADQVHGMAQLNAQTGRLGRRMLALERSFHENGLLLIRSEDMNHGP